MNWETLLVSALSGGVFGSLASVVIPWANWGVEKKKLRFNNRKALIYQVREKLIALDFCEFRMSAEYHEIKEYLPRKLVKRIENNRTVEVSDQPDGKDARVHSILDELSKLERKWQLI